ARYTAFTGELLSLVRAGLPDGPKLLTLGMIYSQLLYRMKKRGLPKPQQRGTGTVDRLALTHNRAYGRKEGWGEKSPILPFDLKGHTGAVYAVACVEAPGGPIAVTGGADCRVRMWDLSSQTQLAAPTGH